jgi:hypothetical protein
VVCDGFPIVSVVISFFVGGTQLYEQPDLQVFQGFFHWAKTCRYAG